MQYRPKSISTSIASQFPAFYRDDAPEFVDFVKTYYEFLDGSNERNFSQQRDIDSTFAQFYTYYKEKFLKDLPRPADEDIPFLIKNIGDLYLSKGTSESLELMFKMFYKVEVETYYPASSILTLSDSDWSFNTFLELKPVSDITDYPLRKGDVIEGDTSKATAFVDEVLFYNVNGQQIPIAFISNVYGSFTSDDGLKVTRNGQLSFPGKLIYGSISEINVTDDSSTANNNVGDPLLLKSYGSGVVGEAIVTGVDDAPTGIVQWELKDGGWGYDTASPTVFTSEANDPAEANLVYVSTQVLIVQGNELDLRPYDVITTETNGNAVLGFANNGNNEYDVQTTIPDIKMYGKGMVIKYEHPNIFLQSLPENDNTLHLGAFVCVDTIDDNNHVKTTIPNPVDIFQPPRSLDVRNLYSTATVTRTSDDGGTSTFNIEIGNLSRYNDTATFKLDSFTNTEEVRIISSIIADFVNVRPYTDGVTGGLPAEINPFTNEPWYQTRIIDGLGIKNKNLGTIKDLLVTNSGSDYKNSVRTIIKHSDIAKYGKGLIGLQFNKSNIRISPGQIFEQTIKVLDLSDESINKETLDVIDYTARGQFVRRSGNTFFFQPLSFYSFRIYDESDPTSAQDIEYGGDTLRVLNINPTNDSPAGLNAVVEGKARSVTGRITDVQVTKSGFRYDNGETVDLINNKVPTELIPNDKYEQVVGRATIKVDGAGRTQGSWKTTTSHISDSNRFVRDNNYYQEYSYEVSSILDPSVYEETLKNTVHVAGTKFFGAPLIATVDNVQPQIDAEVTAGTNTILVKTTESGNPLVIESDSPPGVSGYASLSHIIEAPGDYKFASNTLYQIIDLGDKAGDSVEWRTVAGDANSGVTYSQGSIFQAHNDGAELTNAVVIPAQFAALIETNVITKVSFDEQSAST